MQMPDFRIFDEYPGDELLEALRRDYGRAVNARRELVTLLNDWFYEPLQSADLTEFDPREEARDLLDSEWSDRHTDALEEELAGFLETYLDRAAQGRADPRGQTLQEFFDHFAEFERVLAPYLADAVLTARHGPEAVTTDQIEELADDLGGPFSAAEAQQRLLVEAACAAVDSDDPRSRGRTALADRINVSPKAVRQWINGSRALTGPALVAVADVAELEIDAYRGSHQATA